MIPCGQHHLYSAYQMCIFVVPTDLVVLSSTGVVKFGLLLVLIVGFVTDTIWDESQEVDDNW